MAIEITNNTILKPYDHPELSTNLVPLTIFDLATFNNHVPVIFAFRGPAAPSDSALKDGLSKTLALYPHLCGRMTVDDRNHPCISLNNAGVRLVEARVRAALEGRLPLETTTNLADLHPPVEGVEELFQVQLNRYDCGSLVIGATSHHRVADGLSMNRFYSAWADTVRNSRITTPPPHLDRAATCIPRSPPRCDFDHLGIEFKLHTSSSSSSTTSSLSPANPAITDFVLHFSPKSIAELKSQVPGRSTTFENLLAYVWKKTTTARALKDDELTQVRIAVNGRARLGFPSNFFGNLVLWAYPKMLAGELVRASHKHVVNVIRDAVSKVDGGYFRSFVDFGERLKSRGGGGGMGGKDLMGSAPEGGSVLSPNLEVDSWLGFNSHELDFGTGPPCAKLPPNLPPVEGMIVFVSSYKDGGGVDVFMALLEEHVEVFKTICSVDLSKNAKL